MAASGLDSETRETTKIDLVSFMPRRFPLTAFVFFEIE
jgi:hypothetical protein